MRRMSVASAAVFSMLFGIAAEAPGVDPERLRPTNVDPETLVADGPIQVKFRELDALVGGRLLRMRTEEYEVRKQILEEHVTAILMARAAQLRGLTSEKLREEEVDARVQGVTNEEVQAIYEGAKQSFGNQPEDVAKERIAESLRRQRVAQRLVVYSRELRAEAGVRILLEPPRAVITPERSDIVRGPADAPVSIVEYSDFECPFCARASGTIAKLEEKYKGQVRLVSRSFPLPSHNAAGKAAEAAVCADEQGKFWEMRDKLFANQGAFATGDLKRYANELQLESASFSRCLESNRHTLTWQKSIEGGQSLGVRHTPTFFINGRVVSGAVPFQVFDELIKEELEREGRASSTSRSSSVSSNR